ncbi:MAG: PqqD family protein [bacterium]
MSRSPRAGWREVENIVYLVEPQTTTFHRLNPTASTIWNFIESEKTVEQIVRFLNENYTGDLSSVEKDVSEFIHDMLQKKLIVLHENDH